MAIKTEQEAIVVADRVYDLVRDFLQRDNVRQDIKSGDGTELSIYWTGPVLRLDMKGV